MLPSTLDLLHLDDWYYRRLVPDLTHALARATACAVLTLTATALLNRVGFGVKL
jgi:hypothetical protein